MIVSGQEPLAGTVVSIILSLASIAILAVCMDRRIRPIQNWSKLPLVPWLVLIIYGDSMIFVASTAILSNGFGVETSQDICSKAILLCLACYTTTKLIYYFLVEKVYIIRLGPSSKKRLKDHLYLFNSIALFPYCIIIALNFYFRFAAFENGSCRIGMKKQSMIPLIVYDVVINVYLTGLFLIFLRSLQTYKSRTSPVRIVSIRTFVGSLCTLISSVLNFTVLVTLKGELGWICLMACNADILFSALVLHWITSQDNASTLAPTAVAPKRPIHAHPSREIGLNEYIKMGGVTTLVTASNMDIELERQEEDKYLGGEGAWAALGGIIVEKEHKREVVEILSRKGSKGEDIELEGVEGGKRVSKVESEEELFVKC